MCYGKVGGDKGERGRGKLEEKVGKEK